MAADGGGRKDPPPEKGTKIKEVEEALLYYYDGTLVRISYCTSKRGERRAL